MKVKKYFSKKLAGGVRHKPGDDSVTRRDASSRQLRDERVAEDVDVSVADVSSADVAGLFDR